MLEEAIEVIRLLWQGGYQTHRGKHYRVEKARLYTLPPEPPPIAVAAAGPLAAQLAGRVGDGLITTSPEQELLDAFAEAGGKGKPRYGQATVCWAATEEEGRTITHEWWPIVAVPLTTELATPEEYERVAQLVEEDDVGETVPCGPDPERHLELIRKFVDAGFDHVYVHQIGPDQEGFFRFYAREVMPKL